MSTPVEAVAAKPTERLDRATIVALVAMGVAVLVVWIRAQSGSAFSSARSIARF